MRAAPWLLAGLIGLSSAATVGALRRTSTTFDEIVLVADGARGYHTGRFDLAPDHPPLMQYLYGLPLYVNRVHYPEESGYWGSATRYFYAQALFFLSGNDPQRLAFAARTVAAALAAGLVLVVSLFVWRVWGAATALLAAALVAFLPDVLGHGGVAYNDVPLALAFFAALWAIDAALRGPRAWSGALAGGLCALALAVKFSAVALGAVAVGLLLAEAVARRGEAAWARHLWPAAAAGLLGLYLVLVLVYRGDAMLEGFRAVVRLKLEQVRATHNSPSFLLGHHSRSGWWYYFPLAFFLKTPAALHLMMCLAALGFLRGGAAARRDLLTSPLRPMAAAVVVFLAALLAARNDIGFRYALPVLPPLCVVIAVGVMRLWAAARRARPALLALALWYAGSSLSYYPDFLAYLSEYVPSRDRGYRVLADSSLDWGQGLLELRSFMDREGIGRVYLSYFGSALPEAYGIRYVALPSFLPLPPQPAAPGEPPPTYAVVSLTNLAGNYIDGDRFAPLRQVKPERVLGHTLFVYKVGP